MIEGGTGGGNTVTGLHFEDRIDMIQKFKQINGYTVSEKLGGHLRGVYDIFFRGELVAELCKKYSLYRYLDNRGEGGG